MLHVRSPQSFFSCTNESSSAITWIVHHRCVNIMMWGGHVWTHIARPVRDLAWSEARRAKKTETQRMRRQVSLSLWRTNEGRNMCPKMTPWCVIPSTLHLHASYSSGSAQITAKCFVPTVHRSCVATIFFGHPWMNFLPISVIVMSPASNMSPRAVVFLNCHIHGLPALYFLCSGFVRDW